MYNCFNRLTVGYIQRAFFVTNIIVYTTVRLLKRHALAYENVSLAKWIVAFRAENSFCSRPSLTG